MKLLSKFWSKRSCLGSPLPTAFTRLVSLVAALLLALAGCRATPSATIDAELASCVPSGTRILAGVHLDQLRSSPVLQKLASEWLPLLDPARDASSLLIAYDGKNLLWAARGQFHAAPPGATLLTPQLAIAGPPSLLGLATAQHAAGRTGVPALLAQAQFVANHPIWAVVPRGAALPLSGNAANINHLLDLANYTTLTIDLNSGVALHAAGICGSPDQASQMEETLRGLLALAQTTVRDRDVSALLASVQVRRDNLTVHTDVSGSPEVIGNLLRTVPR
jgi:hypothetical protein